MDKLRDDDFLYSFFMLGGGNCAWIIRREDEIFIQTITGMKSWQVSHFPFVNGEQVAAAIQTLALLGFQESPMYGQVAHLKRNNKMFKVLEQQFKILDDTQEQMRLQAEKQQSATPSK